MDAFHFRVPTPSIPTHAEHHRLTLQDVNIDLPDKKELVLYAHMSPIQRDYYRLAEVRACVRALLACFISLVFRKYTYINALHPSPRFAVCGCLGPSTHPTT